MMDHRQFNEWAGGFAKALMLIANHDTATSFDPMKIGRKDKKWIKIGTLCREVTVRLSDF